MNTENLPSMVQMIVRETALGLTPEDIVALHEGLTHGQLAKMQAGATFKRALKEMNERINDELVQQVVGNPARQFLAGKGLAFAKTISRLATNEDDETPHSVQHKAAVDGLKLGGNADTAAEITLPVIMLSPEKFEAVMAKPNPLADVPDCVDGNNLPL